MVKFIVRSHHFSNAKSIEALTTNIRFEIEDTGVGMTLDQLHTIFLPFEQVGDQRRQTTGTGLGLAISRQLVRLMGTEIQVNSVFGKGSTFWFEVTVPVVLEERATPPVHMRTLIGYKGRRQKVLIVDNDATNRLILRHLLDPLGFVGFEAENGQEAVDRARTIQPDVILIDLFMPVMNGFEAVQQIRQILELADVIVIAISASAFETDQQKSRMVGCDAFLAKPVDAKHLFTVLETYLKVDWIFAEVEEDVGEERPEAFMPDQLLVPPPPDELKVLYEFACRGDILGIRECAAKLEQRDVKFRPFAAKLSQFAKTYQDEPLLTFIESYMEGDA
jgi:CheY-like chemotaxis protein